MPRLRPKKQASLALNHAVDRFVDFWMRANAFGILESKKGAVLAQVRLRPCKLVH
jgi:hypothetical protein